MKHKTIVRLAVKLMGLYLLALGLPSALSQIANIAVSAMQANSGASMLGPNGQWSWMVPNVLYWGTQIVVGLYLLLGGRFIIDLIVPSNRPYCPECGYELRPPVASRCPECGIMLPAAITPRADQQPAPKADATTER